MPGLGLAGIRTLYLNVIPEAVTLAALTRAYLGTGASQGHKNGEVFWGFCKEQVGVEAMGTVR